MDRIPPHNIDAEQSLLGCLMIDTEALPRVIDRIVPADFYKHIHQTVFESIVHLYSRHDPIDILSVGNRLDEMGKLKEVGGRAYLVELSNTTPTAAHIAHYADIVRKKATLRRLISTANDIVRMGYDEGEDELEHVLDKAEQQLFSVSQKMLKQNFVPMTDILAKAFDRIDELHRERGKLRGLPTGFQELDNVLAGLQSSDLIILAARPSVGKTSFALDIGRQVAIRTKQPVAIFSLEMSKEQLVDRMICTQANVDLWKMRTGRLSERDNDFPRIGEALGILAEAPIFIDDTPAVNIMEIRAKCRRLQAEHGLGLVVVDYLQLMESYGSKDDGNRTQEVSRISRGLKQLARELSVPVIVLSQLNRAVELTKPAIPRLAHLRESGSIEQDADVVLFIYRKAADPNFRGEELSPEDKTHAEVHIAKHRNGPTGLIRLYWDAARASFKSLDRQHAPSPARTPTAHPPAETHTKTSRGAAVPPPPMEKPQS